MEKNILKENILVISHEAGSAEIISNFIKSKKKNYYFLLNGSTKKIFKNNGIHTLNNYKKKIKYSQIFFGASYNGSEYSCIKKNNLDSINKICFIDHWVYYKKRLASFNLKKINFFYVFDKYAFLKLKKIVKNSVRINIYKNPSLVELKKNIIKVKKIKKKNIVIFLNNINNKNQDKQIKHLSNEELVHNSLLYVNSHKKLKDKKIYVKLHPANKYNEYKNIIRKYKNLKIIKKKTFIDTMKHTYLAISNDSMVLYFTYALGIKNLNIIKKKTLIPIKYSNLIFKIK